MADSNIDKAQAERAQKNAMNRMPLDNKKEASENYKANMKMSAHYIENSVNHVEQLYHRNQNIFANNMAAMKQLFMSNLVEWASQNENRFKIFRKTIEKSHAGMIASLKSFKDDPKIVEKFGKEIAGKVTDGMETLTEMYRKRGMQVPAGTNMNVGENGLPFHYRKYKAKSVMGESQPTTHEEVAQEKKREGRMRKMFSMLAAPVVLARGKMTEAVDKISNIKDRMISLPKNLTRGLSRMAMTVPNGIVKMTSNLLGGAGQALSGFLEGLGRGFNVLGKMPAIAKGAVAIAAMAGAIGVIGGSVWLVGKGIETVMIGLGNGLNALTGAMVNMSKTEVNSEKVRAVGKAIADFAGEQDIMKTFSAVMLNFLPDLKALTQNIADLQHIVLDGKKLNNISKTISEFLGGFSGISNTMGAIVTRVFDPENTKAFVNVLDSLGGIKLNHDALMNAAGGMGKFLSALNENQGLFDSIGASVKNFLTSKDVFKDMATNINALSAVKPIDKKSTDGIAYFLNTMYEPVKNMTTAGILAQISKDNMLSNFVNQIKSFDQLNLDDGKMEKNARSIKILGEVINNVFTDGLLSSLGRGMINLTQMATGTQMDTIIGELQKFDQVGNINFTGLERLGALIPKIKDFRHEVELLAVSLTKLSDVKSYKLDLSQAAADYRMLQKANEDARNAAIMNQITSVSTNTNNVNNTSVTNVPIMAIRPQSNVDSFLSRGR